MSKTTWPRPTTRDPSRFRDARRDLSFSGRHNLSIHDKFDGGRLAIGMSFRAKLVAIARERKNRPRRDERAADANRVEPRSRFALGISSHAAQRRLVAVFRTGAHA